MNKQKINVKESKVEEKQQNQAQHCYEKCDQYQFKEQILDFAICSNHKQFAVLMASSQMMKIKQTYYQKHQKLIKLKLNINGNDLYVSYSNNKYFIYLICNTSQVVILRNDGQYKLVNKLKISDDEIVCLKQINDQQLIVGHLGGSIIIIDIVLRKQVLQICTQQYFIQQIEYDFKNNVVISQGSDKSIKFFDMRGEIIIEQQLQSPKKRLVLVYLTSENNLMSVSNNDLKLWSIDYTNQQLILLKRLKYLENLQYIEQVQDSKLIIFDKKYIQIIDNNLVHEQREHNISNLSFCCFPYPRNKLKYTNKYILIYSQDQIQNCQINVLKKQT